MATHAADNEAAASDSQQLLNPQLSALTRELGIPQDVTDVLSRELADVAGSGAAPGLHVGDAAPLFALPDATGRVVRLHDLLASGPVVLTFYRGEWCPYCNLELRTWQRHLGEIADGGGQLVAVSPQRPTDALSISERHALEFPVLSDEDQQVIRSYKLRFALPPGLRALYDTAWGIDLPALNPEGSWALPVPGTFVVTPDRRIAYAFASADYRVRAEPADVLAALRSL